MGKYAISGSASGMGADALLRADDWPTSFEYDMGDLDMGDMDSSELGQGPS